MDKSASQRGKIVSTIVQNSLSEAKNFHRTSDELEEKLYRLDVEFGIDKRIKDRHFIFSIFFVPYG